MRVRPRTIFNPALKTVPSLFYPDAALLVLCPRSEPVALSLCLPYNLPAMSADTNFTNPHFLADPRWLKSNLGSPDLVIVDLDAEAGYLRGHVPGAVFLDNNYERNPETGWVDTMPPDRFASVCRNLGIGDDTLVVAYDNNMSLHATRYWWTLSYYGHRNVKVLDGGWRGWVAEDGPIAFDRSHSSTGALFTPRIDPALIAGYDDVRAACPIGGNNSDKAVIWDTRTTAEFSGAVSRNKRPGHVAGAVHLDWMDLMDRETLRFKSPDELRQLLDGVGITADKAIFAY